MVIAADDFSSRSRLKALLHHFSRIEDPRAPWRVMYPLREILFLAVCATVCDCDDYEHIAACGETHLDFLRRYLPYERGTPCGRWLTLFMNRINPVLFQAAFTAFVREAWPDKPALVAIKPAPAKAGGKTSRASHDKARGGPPLHLVQAFASAERLVLGQQAVADKSNEIGAIPILLQRLAKNDGLAGAIITIDAIATNPACASAILAAKADYILAVNDNQPTLRREIEAAFETAAPRELDADTDTGKGHGRIEERVTAVLHDVNWLTAERHYPGELRLPQIRCLIRTRRRTELKDRCRAETRCYISSRCLTAAQAGTAVRGHWAIENQLHWVLDTVFKEDQSRLRKGHGAQNMVIVRHFVINLARAVKDKRTIKLRRKYAGWNL